MVKLEEQQQKQEQRAEPSKYRPEQYFNEWMAEARLFQRLSANLDEDGRRSLVGVIHLLYDIIGEATDNYEQDFRRSEQSNKPKRVVVANER